jgi:hypothetical protein
LILHFNCPIDPFNLFLFKLILFHFFIKFFLKYSDFLLLLVDL